VKIKNFFYLVLVIIFGGVLFEILENPPRPWECFYFLLLLTAAPILALKTRDKFFISILFCISMVYAIVIGMKFVAEENMWGMTSVTVIVGFQVLTICFLALGILDDAAIWVWESKMFAPIRVIYWLIVEFIPMLKQARGY
jgi:hypothetical protein